MLSRHKASYAMTAAHAHLRIILHPLSYIFTPSVFPLLSPLSLTLYRSVALSFTPRSPSLSLSLSLFLLHCLLLPFSIPLSVSLSLLSPFISLCQSETERARETEKEKELFISLYVHVFWFSMVLVSLTFSESTERHSYQVRPVSPADHGGHGDIDYRLVKRSIVRGSGMSWLFHLI